ncbi:uncharacterized protein LOC126994788, partial [Eriocheir sinensis]|uniref:uncharacterized protein LOC126994788 n=1 Tax=Eriocheir sinensis TaxID=95602 RepID=UPI0021C63A25
MELDIGVNYTAHSGPKKSCDGTKQIFYCRRSGVQSTKISSKSRAEKSQGTCKMGFYCTSSIEVVKKDEKICVTFYSDHRDHNLDFNSQVHMTLPKSEQDKIAACDEIIISAKRMITQGIEHDIILDRVRESAGSNRMSFLEKKDIDNICVRYGLNKTHSRHSDDSTSVRLIVKEMQDANEVLYFKDQGDVDSDNPEIPSKEFVLGFMKGGQELIFSTQMKSCDKIQVCMDSTHCISNQMVRVLMDEQEENEFHKQCKGFLSYLLEAGFERFHDYFKENYLCENRIQLWPQCYHEGAILNTNNHLESIHRLLKYVYLKGKKVKRLDYTILALNKMVKEKLFKRMVDLMKKRTGKPFRERHEKGMKLEVTQEDHGLFTVSSESFENKLYEIQTNNPTCEVCRERCPDCHVCKCMYVCTCDDNAKGMKNICKHIHTVAEFLRNKSQIAKPKLPTEEIEKIHDV